MRAISLWQPWASLMVMGIKEIETRGWPTQYRGDLLIHAAKRQNKGEMAEISNHPDYDAALYKIGGASVDNLLKLPYGAIIGKVKLVDCVSTNKLDMLPIISAHFVNDEKFGSFSEFALGNFDPNRFAWFTEDPMQFKTPISFKGAQGFFDVPDGMIADALQIGVLT